MHTVCEYPLLRAHEAWHTLNDGTAGMCVYDWLVATPPNHKPCKPARSLACVVHMCCCCSPVAEYDDGEGALCVLWWGVVGGPQQARQACVVCVCVCVVSADVEMADRQADEGDRQAAPEKEIFWFWSHTPSAKTVFCAVALSSFSLVVEGFLKPQLT